MEVTVNGEIMHFSEELATIEHLVHFMGIKSPVVIVELNGRILQQEEHTGALVNPGDKVELVQFVGGG
ncbi:MAG TPA: sulfur carrier protein ThiS [Virgibacillus sp.]|nr:sulfur carrier protein ThiS [Virgibacillus sp.]